MSRTIPYTYQDPLDAIWLDCAKKMGLTVKRGPETYASTDGRGSLTLSDSAGMDKDDCIAQMVLHEICHSLVQGTQSFGWVDWGLDNVGEVDVEREHACLRLQAALLGPLGLRVALGPTTDFRAYYDALPVDPFEERVPADREAIVRARAAWGRRNRRPYRGHLSTALEATANIFQLLAENLRGSTEATLYKTVQPRTANNPVGLPLRAEATESTPVTCGSCAWSFEGGPGKPVLRCRQAAGARIQAETAACERFESEFDCLGCGACCREAYDTVEVSSRDPAKKHHLDLMVERSGGLDMKREGPRCSCLMGGTPLSPPRPAISGGTETEDAGERVAPLCMPGGAPFTCKIYETRPRTCREFTIFSDHCLDARRTVGLSR